MPSERTLQLSFEDLVTAPEASSRALCEVVGVSYCNDMATPYTERNMASFAPVEAGGLGAGDPHMLARKGIDPALADAWRKASPPVRDRAKRRPQPIWFEITKPCIHI